MTQINRPLLSAALNTCKQVILDIDATPILCSKRSAQYTYRKEQGYVPMVEHIEEVSQVVSMHFRPDSLAPAKAKLDVIKQCMAALPEGMQVSKLRIDRQ